MTRLDFIETVKVLLPSLEEQKIGNAIVFFGVKISFDGSKVKVRGRIPYEVAMRIFENYPCDRYGIRLGSIGTGTDPSAFLKDEIYENELNRVVKDESVEARAKRLDKARQKLQARQDSDKYVDIYRIDTKEGLVIFMQELGDYYVKKNWLRTYTEDDIKTSLMKINTRVIDKINPRVCNHDWMMQTVNVQEYFEGWNRFKSNQARREFRRALEEFDSTVNPFIAGDLSTEEIIRDLDSAEIRTYPFSYSEEYRDELDFYEINIENRDLGSKVKFSRNPNGFLYSFICTLGDKEFFIVQYSGDKKEENCGEILTICYFGDNSPIQRKMKLNLTKGTVGLADKPKAPMNEANLGLMYLDLVKAIKLAANVTVYNFEKNKTITLQ